MTINTLQLQQQTENNETNPSYKNDEDKNSDNITLDSILIQIGQFGRYQIFNYILLCFPMIFNAFFSISYVFTASTVVHRCNITECDSLYSQYNEIWLNFTIPLKNSNIDQCNRFASMSQQSYTEPSSYYCREDYFNQNQIEKCSHNFKFRDITEITISNEFNIFCSDEWKLSMVGTINNVGQFIGIPLGGLLADRYGRRTMLAICGFFSGLMGIIRSFSVDYYMFLAFELLDQIVGSTLFPTAFLLAIEFVSPKHRVPAATIITIFYSLGEAFLAVLAQQFQNWRHLLCVLYIPAVFQLIFLWILPESVRWLFSQGQDVKAVNVLKRAAYINKRHVDKSSFEQLITTNRQILTEANEKRFPILKALKLFHWRIINCCFCWFTHTLVALGLSLNSVNLNGNKYYNFMWNGVVQVPGLLLPLFIMDRIGRRFSLFGSMLICSICMAASILIGHNNSTMELVLFLLGKLAITCSFQILYFFTSEIFPTKLRNSLLSLCSMVGRIGSMLAPQTPLLANYYEYAPQIVFGIFALTSGLLTLYFPETTDQILPTTVDQANDLNLQQESKKVNEFE